MNVHRVEVEWGRAVEPETVRSAFKEVPDAVALLVQASESLAGSDPIKARLPYARAPIEFLPQLTLWIVTNNRPRLPADDDAVWERLREIPFRQYIPEEERDPRIREALRDPSCHGAAILAWAVEGLRLYRADRLKPPEIVREATAENRREQDPLAEFWDQVCMFNAEHRTRAADLRDAVQRWCDQEGQKPPSGKGLAAKLKARGCTSERTHGARTWVGVGLIHESRTGGVTP